MTHEHDCTHYLPGLSDYLDGERNSELCSELERHLTDCEKCRIVVDTIRKTIELYHVSTDTKKTPVEVKERLYKRLHLEDFMSKTDLETNHD